MPADLSRWPEADALLDEALALPAADRPAFVRRAAGHDAALARALAVVLAESAHDDFLPPGGALSGGLGDEVARELEGSAARRPALQVGSRIEHYEVGELIGAGGMDI